MGRPSSGLRPPPSFLLQGRGSSGGLPGRGGSVWTGGAGGGRALRLPSPGRGPPARGLSGGRGVCSLGSLRGRPRAGILVCPVNFAQTKSSIRPRREGPGNYLYRQEQHVENIKRKHVSPSHSPGSEYLNICFRDRPRRVEVAAASGFRGMRVARRPVGPCDQEWATWRPGPTSLCLGSAPGA